MVLTACPALLSDWTVAASGGDDASADARSSDAAGSSGTGGSSGSSSGSSTGSSSASSSGSSWGGADASPASEGGPETQAEASADASTDVAPPTCVTDLSNVGTGDFQIAFTLTTTETVTTLALVNQRTGCDETSSFWDVTISNTGGIVFATDDGSAASYAFVEAGNSINDGNPHHVVVSRTTAGIALSADGTAVSSTTPDPYAFGTFPTLNVGTNGCSGLSPATPLAGHGTLTDLCISR
jgi:hypothetical protein